MGSTTTRCIGDLLTLLSLAVLQRIGVARKWMSHGSRANLISGARNFSPIVHSLVGNDGIDRSVQAGAEHEEPKCHDDYVGNRLSRLPWA